MKSLRTKAIVLRRTNYGEADRVLQLLTPDGQVSAIAKGVRREKSRLAGGIELFAISDVVVAKGRGDLGILTSSRLIEFYGRILEDYDRLQFAYESIKQIAKASGSVSEPEWFDMLAEILAALNNKSIHLGLIETRFYLRYADLMGHALNLHQDIAGARLEAGKKYTYDISEQGLRESGAGDISTDHIKLLRLTSVKTLDLLSQISGLESILSTCLLTARQHASI